MFLSRLILAYFAIANVVALKTFSRRNFGVSEEIVLRTFNVSSHSFEQKLDHFNPAEKRTWKQRYFVTEEFFKGTKDGPVFLNIGGEGAADTYWMNYGNPWITDAKRYNALCFMVEHRYYGRSQPTHDWSTENLQYLSSQQALADLATFIVTMNKKYHLSTDVKWIVFGGSYSGSLAAWMRKKYPRLVHGAVSSSAPLVAKVDFKEYLEVVEESLGTHDDQCVGDVRKSFVELEELLQSAEGREKIVEMFQTCEKNADRLKNKQDLSSFYEQVIGFISSGVQYNKILPVGIDCYCNSIANQTKPLKSFAGVIGLTLMLNNIGCVEYRYETVINDYKEIVCNKDAYWRQWLYQTCTEFGFYQTSSQPDHIFGNKIPIEYFIQQCQDVFGPGFNRTFLDKAVSRTNTMYGGLDINVTNVVFVQGSLDPWHALGLTKTRSKDAPVIYIDGTAHCANMLPPTPIDPPQLVAARKEIDGLVGKWLGF